MNYLSFQKIFVELSNEKKIIVCDVMHKLDHSIPQMDYSKAMKWALEESGHTFESMREAIKSRRRKIDNYLNDEYLDAAVNADILKKMIQRGSTKSVYYDDFLKVLHINDEYLHEIYNEYVHTSVEGLYTALSEADQNTVYNLAMALMGSDKDIICMTDNMDLNG